MVITTSPRGYRMRYYDVKGKRFASLTIVLTPEMARFAEAQGMSKSHFIEHLLRQEYRKYQEESC